MMTLTGYFFEGWVETTTFGQSNLAMTDHNFEPRIIIRWVRWVILHRQLAIAG
jgi:hypothetical protein